MRKILAVLCVAFAVASATENQKKAKIIARAWSGIPFLSDFQKIPHQQPKYRTIIRQALASVGVPIDGLKIISFHRMNVSWKEQYKVKYITPAGETCVMTWSVLSFVGSINIDEFDCSGDTPGLNENTGIAGSSEMPSRNEKTGKTDQKGKTGQTGETDGETDDASLNLDAELAILDKIGKLLEPSGGGAKKH